MSGRVMEDDDLLRAAEYALVIVRRTEELAMADSLWAEYHAAHVMLTAYVQALQTTILPRHEQSGVPRQAAASLDQPRHVTAG